MGSKTSGKKVQLMLQDEPSQRTMDTISRNMKGAIVQFEHSLNQLRSDRPTPSVFDFVRVDAYGDSVSLPQVAQVSVPSSRCVLLHIYDPSLVKNVESSVRALNDFYHVSIDANKVQVNFPKMSKEVRTDMVKSLKKISEQARQHVRRARQDGLTQFKKRKAELSEDQLGHAKEFIQSMTDESIAALQVLSDAKERDLTENI